MRGFVPVATTLLFLICWPRVEAQSPPLAIEGQVSHGYATNNGVRVHFAEMGKGPLIVMTDCRGPGGMGSRSGGQDAVCRGVSTFGF